MVKAKSTASVNGDVFLSANDPKNPLRPYRVPITSQIVKIAENLLASKSDLSPHQKALIFMEYISQFDVGVASDSTPETTIKERIGACGTFTNLFLALASTQGIKGRIISLGNYPRNDGHAVAELWINGKWNLYDPTYASFYTDTADNEIDPNVLSFSELRKGEGKRKGVVLILKGEERFKRSPLQAKDYVGTDIYEKAKPAGPIGPENPFLYPLFLEVGKREVLQKSDFGPENQGAQYIGAAGVNNNQSWELTSLVKGREYEFTIVPDWIGGDIINNDYSFQLTADVVSGGELLGESTIVFNANKLNPWTIRFRAENDVANIIIKHPYLGPNFKYIFLKEIRIDTV